VTPCRDIRLHGGVGAPRALGQHLRDDGAEHRRGERRRRGGPAHVPPREEQRVQVPASNARYDKVLQTTQRLGKF